MSAKVCSCFLTCGVMAEALTANMTTPAGVLVGPRERLVTIAGRVSSEQPYQQLRIVVADAFIKECADANAQSKERVLGSGGAMVKILPNRTYRIVGLPRNWCTTTYVLAIRVDDWPLLRYEIHLQGVASQMRHDLWSTNHDIVLQRPPPATPPIPAPVAGPGAPPVTNPATSSTTLKAPKVKGNAKGKKAPKKTSPTDSVEVA